REHRREHGGGGGRPHALDELAAALGPAEHRILDRAVDRPLQLRHRALLGNRNGARRRGAIVPWVSRRRWRECLSGEQAACLTSSATMRGILPRSRRRRRIATAAKSGTSRKVPIERARA